MSSKLETFENFVENYTKQPAQGLKLCRKKLQKDPSNHVFLLAQAAFLSELGKPQDAIDSCDSVKASANAPLEPGFIIAMQNILKACQIELGKFTGFAGPRLIGFWKDALDNCPKAWIKETRTETFNSALELGYYDLAQQLFLRLQKEYPQNPRYHFAWIGLCAYQAGTLKPGDKVVESLKMLAYRSLKIVIDNTLNDKDTPRKILTAADLSLVITVFSSQGRFDELIDVLNSPKMGIPSEAGKFDLQFVRTKIICLKECRRWSELGDYCLSGLRALYSFLEQADSAANADVPNQLAWANNYNVWEAGFEAHEHEPEIEAPKQMYELTQKFLTLNVKYRTAAFARLSHAHIYDRANLQDVCQKYFDTFKTHTTCSKDLEAVIANLSEAEGIALSKYMETATDQEPNRIHDEEKIVRRWAQSRLHALQISSAITQKRLQGISAAGSEVLRAVVEYLKFYTLLAGDHDNAAVEDAILTAICVLNSTGNSERTECTLQAAFLATHARRRSPNNHNFKLQEVLSYRLLGMGSLAISAFRRLDVKSVQWESLAHVILTRLCTLHPFAAKDGTDPQKLVLDAMAAAKSLEDASLKLLCKDLETVHFAVIDEFLSMKRKVSSSFGQFYIPLELQRMRRIVGTSKISYSLPREFDFDFVDNRDYDLVPGHSTAGITYMETMMGGFKPLGAWAARWQLHELISVLLAVKPTTLTENQARIVDRLFRYIHQHAKHATEETTPQEREVFQAWDLIIPLVFFLNFGPSSLHASKDPKKDLKALTEVLEMAALAIRTENLRIGGSHGFVFTSLSLIERRYLHLEVAQVSSAFMANANAALKQKSHHASSGFSAVALNDLKKEVTTLVEIVHSGCKALKETLKQRGRSMILDAVTNGEVGQEIRDIIKDEDLNQYSGEFVDGAIDSLDGLLKVKATL